ncbi:hypothetical protein [Embleya sp. MST-111070]|uniref:hypothetical protein n=1 Tax=Embleya sp. MST-111070 TaxID=3398231 RepID=UPI003F73B124
MTTSHEWNDHTIVRIDAEDDRVRTADGFGYDAYLRKNLPEWDDAVDDVGEFVAWAWRVATEPIMEPGYVRLRPDIAQIRIEVDYEEGGPIAVAVLPIRHQALARRPRAGDWAVDVHDAGAGPYQSVGEPSRKSPVVVATATVVVPAGGWELPRLPRKEDPGVYTRAREAIDALVRGINTDLAPLVADLYAP